MRSLGELGIGLSAVFCVFVLALVVELCYLSYWKRGKLATSIFFADRLKLVNIGTDMRSRGKRPLTSEYVREASLVGSFGGYPSAVLPDAGSGAGFDPLFGDRLLYSSSQYVPSHELLFSIKEETKEDLELAYSGLGSCTMKPLSWLRSRTPSTDVLAIHFTSGSSSSSVASLGTPFTSPTTSSPPALEKLTPVPAPAPAMPKLSPFAACAVRPTSCGKPSSPIAEIHILSGYQSSPSPLVSGRREGTTLSMLFERSPLWQRACWPQSPRAHLPNSPLGYLQAGAAESFNVSELPPFCHRLSLGTLFCQTSSAPCYSPHQSECDRCVMDV